MEKRLWIIFNYYAENSFTAYPELKLPYEFYGKFPVFKETAEISYFINKDYVRKGIGKKTLSILEEDAKKLPYKTFYK